MKNLKRLQKAREIEKASILNYSKNMTHHLSKYTPLQIIQVCLRLAKNESATTISKKTSVDIRTVYLIKSGRIWKNISSYFSFKNDGIIDDSVVDTLTNMKKHNASLTAVLKYLNLPNDDVINKTIKDIYNAI